MPPPPIDPPDLQLLCRVFCFCLENPGEEIPQSLEALGDLVDSDEGDLNDLYEKVLYEVLE